ncbi:MAG TPA: SCP2 sterol-binding domain-containing protein [Thermoplasmataceae archaeon]|nr:SCP2 sterol-binding domain-containing protein [Thermoplasmataceae archaeon]
MTSKEDLAAIVEKANSSPEVLKELSSWSKTFQFDVSDESPYYVSIDKGKVSLEDGKSSSAAATISATGSVLSELFSGNLNPVQAFMSGKLKVSGDVFSAQKLTSIINKARK